MLIDDLRRLIVKVKNLKRKKIAEPVQEATAGEPISRSAFLVKAGLVTAAVPLTSLSWGIVSGAYDYQIKRVKLVLPNLPKAFDGITTVSYTHLDVYKRQRLYKMLKLIMALAILR